MTETIPETARLTADVVLFSERDGTWFVLLIRRGAKPFEGCWALPGGHVDVGEGTQDAAQRELAEETGILVAHRELALVGAYAAPGRDPRGRYVTFAYWAAIEGAVEPTAADDATEAAWKPVDAVLDDGVLAFDHAEIIRDSLKAAGIDPDPFGLAEPARPIPELVALFKRHRVTPSGEGGEQ